ncbi:hypothetical protein TIFTF001_039860 [Ficus carica]|uniref:Uncharacterized protein n=1 Tax=Ficus carica TaxID=3494 RepID=A0AA88CHA6_FICCA|nr:hypothetical protein TIFTF001_039860 [Ficus carica]
MIEDDQVELESTRSHSESDRPGSSRSLSSYHADDRDEIWHLQSLHPDGAPILNGDISHILLLAGLLCRDLTLLHIFIGNFNIPCKIWKEWLTTKIQEMEERHQKDVKEVSQLKSLHEKDLIEISRLQNKINCNPLSAAEGSLHEDRISKRQSEFEAYDQSASSNFDSSISTLINSLNDSPSMTPSKLHPLIKLLEDQLAGAKAFSATLLKSKQELKKRCREKIHNAKTYFRTISGRFKSIAEFYKSFGFDFAKDNCRAITDRTVNEDDVDFFDSKLNSGSDSSDDDYYIV